MIVIVEVISSSQFLISILSELRSCRVLRAFYLYGTDISASLSSRKCLVVNIFQY